jgi:hypothetical protein
VAIGDNYATMNELKAYILGELADSDTVDDAELTDALDSVSREIERECGRQFNDSGTASARVFYPLTDRIAYVDDFSTTDNLVIATDVNDDGTYETTWSSADYQLEPLNGIVEGQPGWPFWVIRAVGSKTFPTCSRRAPLQVTAQWGWAEVPAPVHQACLILAAETHKLRRAPFGVAGFGEFGVVRVRDNPMAARKLGPYMLDPTKVA